MNRKIGALISLALSLGWQTWLHMHGYTDNPGWLLWPLVIGITAFLLPAMLPVIVVEHALDFAPWGEGHTALTYLYMTLAAALIWFFPPRVFRWFGIFDAFEESLWLRLRKRLRLPSFWQAAAAALDTLHRLKLGKGKNGGWA